MVEGTHYMALRSADRFEQIWRIFLGLAIGPTVLIVGIVMKVSHSVSCGDVNMSPGDVCRDNDSGATKTYDEVASGSQGTSTFLIIIGIVITLIAGAWFLNRWQSRAERPLLPPKSAKREPTKWAWVEARLAENSQNGLAVRVSPSRYPTFMAARSGLKKHLSTQGQSDPVYARGAAAFAAANSPLPTVVAAPLLWFLVELPAKEGAKERMREVLATRAPRLREMLQDAETAEPA